jgi:hypothetical protein
MRIETAPGETVSSVGLFVTVLEARELRDSLDAMLTDRAARGPASRHEHVSSTDYQTEITVAWEDA